MGWAGWGIVALLLIGVPAACHTSIAQGPPVLPAAGVRLTPQACRQLAELVAAAAQARDKGLRHRQFVDALSRSFDAAVPKVSEVSRRIVYREMRRVFASTLAPAQLELEVYTRCVTEPMGEERA